MYIFRQLFHHWSDSDFPKIFFINISDLTISYQRYRQIMVALFWIPVFFMCPVVLMTPRTSQQTDKLCLPPVVCLCNYSFHFWQRAFRGHVTSEHIIGPFIKLNLCDSTNNHLRVRAEGCRETEAGSLFTSGCLWDGAEQKLSWERKIIDKKSAWRD